MSNDLSSLHHATYPKEWRRLPLSSVARVFAGSAAPQGERFFHPSGPPFVRVSDLGQHGKTSNLAETRDHLSELALTALPLVKARKGTVLFPKSGAAIATNTRAILGVDAYVVSHLMAVEPGPETTSDWLFFWLSQLDMMEVADNSAYPSLKKSEVARLPVPLPPLPEQRRIAAKLREQMAVVARAARAADELQRANAHLLPASLREAFLGITPLTAERSRDKPPSGWRWRRLSDIARLESGHTPSRSHPEWWGGEIRWLALPDIRALDGREALESAERTNELGIQNSSARVLPRGTVVLSRTASVGFVSVLGRPMATSQDFVNWVCTDELDPWFLAYLLMASRQYIHTLSSGAVHKTVYMPTARAFEVCIPSLEEQRRIAAIIARTAAAAETAGRAADESSTLLHSLPAALLRRAFSGGA